MPASLFHDSDHTTSTTKTINNTNVSTSATTTATNNSLTVNNGSTLEEQRALQLALELTMLGLMNDDDQMQNYTDGEQRTKKSQNTTECVPVPSSEHVAEIVGRQGCKIKALRAKTNTYIKTPVRGEEPVFVVTGRKEDVSAAKREILSAAEHFSQIRAQRKNNLNSLNGLGPNGNVPGQTTIQVRVPYRVVGLVVGPKGATIKRIQQQTNTYIITPSRDKEPTFEVTGLPDNVETARKEIEAHIAIRTGGIIDSTAGSSSHSSSDSDSGAQDFTTTSSSSPSFNGLDNPFSPSSNNQFKNGTTDPYSTFSTNGNSLGLVEDILSPQSQDIFSFNLNGGLNGNTNNNNNNINNNNNNNNNNSTLYNNTINSKLNSGIGKLNDFYSTFNGSGFNYGFGNFNERDEGIGDSPTFETIGATLAANQTTFNNTISSLWSDLLSSSASSLTTTTTTACGQLSSSVAAPQRPFPSTISPLGRRNSGIGSQNSP